MRVVARRRGCSYAVTEALLDTTLLQGGQGLKNSIDINDEDHPLAGQLIGSDPQTMSGAARILHQFHYDVIDLNFACPVKKIKNKARGGHMLRDVERGISILRAVRDALPYATLTVSLRRAYGDTDHDHHALCQLIDQMWRLNYAAVRVHGRTVEQKYLGRADWTSLGDLKIRYPDKTIFGSGDVFTAQDAVRMKLQTNVDIVWIARGAIGNPWIFRHAHALLENPNTKLDPPTITEQRDALAEHFEIAMQIHGEQLAGRRMRKMGIKYARFHPDALEVKKAFIDVRSLREWNDVLERHYSSDGNGVWPNPTSANQVDPTESCALD